MKLETYLSERSISDATFAQAIGVDRSSISRMRRGQIPSKDVMVKIADATGGKVTANDFFGIATKVTPSARTPKQGAVA